MSSLKESKIQIIRDIPRIPTNIRFARAASPLLGLGEARLEARKFVKQHNPNNLSCEDVVEITDTKGNTIGGAIIWEASWVKESDTPRKEDTLVALREALQEEQMDQPSNHYLIN